jgi:hypothetical protein
MPTDDASAELKRGVACRSDSPRAVCQAKRRDVRHPVAFAFRARTLTCFFPFALC